MPYNGQNLNSTGSAGFPDNNSFRRGSSNATDDCFDIFNTGNNTGLDLQNHQHAGPSEPSKLWYLRVPQVGGPSQLHAGPEVAGSLNGLSHLNDPITAPVSLYPGSQVSLDEGHSSRGDGEWAQVPHPDPFGFFSSDRPLPRPAPMITPPGTFSPSSVASTSGPQRTSQNAKGKRRYNPRRSTRRKKDVDEEDQEDGWDVTLAHFRDKLNEIVYNGQPSGGLSPETALVAKIVALVKADLKRSPLQNTKAGEGTRPRDVEEYLTGVLREFLPTPVPEQGGSVDNLKTSFLERLADTLEAMLVAVNQRPALRQPPKSPNSRIGKGARHEQTEERVKKNQRERERRDDERFHVGRISYLFRTADPDRTWTRLEVLCFAAAFLLYGPDAFSAGFIEVASA